MRSSSQNLTPRFVLSLIVLSLALVFGGGQGTLGDTLTQLSAIVLMLMLVLHNPRLKTWPKSSYWAILPLIPLLIFLLPLPNALTDLGPARTRISHLLTPIIGSLGNHASLSPVATERALLWLLPAVALYLSALQFNKSQRLISASVLVVWVFIGAVLGLAQKAGGLDSSLYFYSNTNYGSAVGFFANSNHYAISMAASLPLIWAGLTMLFNRRSTRSVNPLMFLALACMAIFFIIGFMLSGSRAGLALGMFGCLLMLPAVILADEHKDAKHWLFGAMAVGLFFSVQIGLYFISLQFEVDPLDDLRWQLFPITGQAANQFAPWGSGPGSFWYVFPQYDNFLTGDVIANHAHNDYLELWLETRWLFVMASAEALLAFFWQGIRIWFRTEGFHAESTLLARSAWVGLLILLLHSMVDYPLRTTAVSGMAGLLTAFLIRIESKQRHQHQD